MVVGYDTPMKNIMAEKMRSYLYIWFLFKSYIYITKENLKVNKKPSH